MTRDPYARQLTPLERLQIRDALQDRWRERVRQITLLTLARHDRGAADEVASPTGNETDVNSLDVFIHRARAHLEDIEQAMHRLDERSYGQCHGCGEPIGFTRLVQEPERTRCEECARKVDAPSNVSRDMSVA